MLKIVDCYPGTEIPFPLEELEKFGFYKHYHSGNYQKIIEQRYLGLSMQFATITKSIFITAKNRIIYYCTDENGQRLATIDNSYIQDLIQAGFVEKVEG